jgi:hypothetical protein
MDGHGQTRMQVGFERRTFLKPVLILTFSTWRRNSQRMVHGRVRGFSINTAIGEFESQMDEDFQRLIHANKR